MENIGRPVKFTTGGVEWYYQMFWDGAGNETGANLYDSGGDFVKEFVSLEKLMTWAKRKSEREKARRIEKGVQEAEKYDKGKKRGLRNEWITAEEKEETQRFFVDRLKELVGEDGIDSFAEKIGMNSGTISGYINRRRFPTAYAVKRIAMRCDVTTDWLLGVIDNRQK